MGRPIYLIQPPVSLSGHTPCLDDKQFGLGILALSAYLRRNGYTVKGRHIPNLLWNSAASLQTIIDDIARDRPLLIAIGLNWIHFSRGAVGIARLLRKACPDVPIVIGGQHATLFASEIAEHAEGCVDAVLNGEAERTLLSICDHFSDCEVLPESLPGVIRAEDVRNGLAAKSPDIVENLDDLPFYDFGVLERRNGEDSAIAALSTCRGGCPYKCAFCVEHVIGSLQGRKKLTFHSAEWIAEHIRHLTDQGIRRVTIQDSFFIAGDKLVCEVSDILARKGVRLDHINIFAHPDSFTADGFAAMKRMAKAASVDFGVETGSEDVLKLLSRPSHVGVTVDRIKDAVRAGVVPYTWWLSGLPDAPGAEDDTRELMEETIKAGGIPRWVSSLVLLPRTPMHEQASRYGVVPRHQSFDDYARFSDISLAEALHFDDAITHRTAEKTYDGIVAETARLRRCLSDHFSEVEEFWTSRSDLMVDDLGQIKQRIEASFF